MAQIRREKRNISGWLVLNKPSERCQQKWSALLRFGKATTRESNG